MTRPPRVVVIGAGPAGLMAAGEAAVAGAAVTVLEAEERAGKKLLLTGKGRCNLSNTLPLEHFLEGFGPQGAFLRNGCHRFFSAELRAFLDGLGVATAVERGGRIYPAQGGAAAVLRALLSRARGAGAHLATGRRVSRLARGRDDRFLVSGEGFSLGADRVVLAAGGSSYPQTGSRGDGCRLAAALGHRIVPLRPALVPVRCRERFLPRLAGLRLRHVRLSAPGCSPPLAVFGEVHCTPFGISGPAVFPASRRIGELCAGGPLDLRLDFKPALPEATLAARLEREIAAGATVGAVMATLLPRQAIPVFLEVAGMRPDLPAPRLTPEHRRRILGLLRGFPLTAVGTLPLEKGMVTAGGVALREVHPVTMESRLVPGLHVAGETLDLDGDTGGYNLQAAFTTGFLSGRAAALPA